MKKYKCYYKHNNYDIVIENYNKTLNQLLSK